MTFQIWDTVETSAGFSALMFDSRVLSARLDIDFWREMRLLFKLPKVEPEGFQPLEVCPHPGCNGKHFKLLQEVPRPLRDTQYSEVWARRYRCVRCGRTFRVYPAGVCREHFSQRVKGLAPVGAELRGRISAAGSAGGFYEQDKGWFIFSWELVYTLGCLKKSAACSTAYRAAGLWSACADRHVGVGRCAARSAQRGRFQSGGIRCIARSVNQLLTIPRVHCKKVTSPPGGRGYA